ncbi:hypothetical protein [Limnohabitans sp.]|jgi:hypothetical protein|uniref:hypothetical protein n=1 Tax=Limnohabitans sp. TaxID=1907725 RepID=UPI003340F9AD
MNFQIRVPLNTSPEQYARLCALRVVFAQVCNQLAPSVQQSRVWNRVALHHLHYRALRAQFPALGSQMVCNAIYAVSKMARLIYQHPQSPFNPALKPGAALPLLRFADSCPVYFDRHTLSIKPGQLSLFTMDGRMRFDLTLEPEKLAVFEQAKLREIVLNERSDKVFELSFHLDTTEAPEPDALAEAVAQGAASVALIPEYVSVEVTP